jgi:hypothetical protein
MVVAFYVVQWNVGILLNLGRPTTSNLTNIMIYVIIIGYLGWELPNDSPGREMS